MGNLFVFGFGAVIGLVGVGGIMLVVGALSLLVQYAT